MLLIKFEVQELKEARAFFKRFDIAVGFSKSDVEKTLKQHGKNLRQDGINDFSMALRLYLKLYSIQPG